MNQHTNAQTCIYIYMYSYILHTTSNMHIYLFFCTPCHYQNCLNCILIVFYIWKVNIKIKSKIALKTSFKSFIIWFTNEYIIDKILIVLKLPLIFKSIQLCMCTWERGFIFVNMYICVYLAHYCQNIIFGWLYIFCVFSNPVLRTEKWCFLNWQMGIM